MISFWKMIEREIEREISIKRNLQKSKLGLQANPVSQDQ